jgi:hypothetical protein
MISRVIRRTHMYLALFLTPWVLMYSLSTMTMNHRESIKSYYDHSPAEWEIERRIPYDVTFSEDISRSMVAEQILQDLDLEGAHKVRGRLDRSISIERHIPGAVRRITYTVASKELKIERQVFRTPAFLEQMHRRRGYGQKFMTDDLWAVCVDLFILSTVLWGASGLWMWWELKITRRWGAIFLGSGFALFGFFLMTI